MTIKTKCSGRTYRYGQNETNSLIKMANSYFVRPKNSVFIPVSIRA